MSIETHIDFAGNVIGIRKGTDKTKKPIQITIIQTLKIK